MHNLTVKIPSVLTPLSNGERLVSVNGDTVRGAIANLEEKYPGFEEKLYDANGKLHSYVNIYLGSENTDFIDGLDTKINDETEIRILPTIAGG